MVFENISRETITKHLIMQIQDNSILRVHLSDAWHIRVIIWWFQTLSHLHLWHRFTGLLLDRLHDRLLPLARLVAASTTVHLPEELA